jgi:hypothetical protein
MGIQVMSEYVAVPGPVFSALLREGMLYPVGFTFGRSDFQEAPDSRSKDKRGWYFYGIDREDDLIEVWVKEKADA